MKKRMTLIVLVFCLINITAVAQQRSVSVIHDNQMFNYTITRYSPPWEIQSGEQKDSNGMLSENAKLFKRVDDAKVDNLKGLLYSKGFVPSEIKSVNGRSMEDYLARKKLVMHYRIQYKEHTIFIAHLNSSATRSVIPFRVESGKWLLDPDFVESDFFHLIAQPYFDVFTGVFNGQPFSYLAFEEVDANGIIYDYSGRGRNGKTSKTSIVDGRIGGALKLTDDSRLNVSFIDESSLKGDRFSISGHLNVMDVVSNADRQRVVFKVQNDLGIAIEVYLENGNINVRTVGAKSLSVPCPKKDLWFHFAIKQAGKKLSLEIDGEELTATTINASDLMYGSVLSFGGENSFKGYLDELLIAK
ncbi:MAG: LamG domain-containing protein [Flavobacteriales bacterium]|nr:LamG domain-containing protein [Flavobacteriales bacterium]